MTLTDFLAEVSLVADIDSMPDTKDYVALMTLHSAKGLEYANVYMTGMEDGLFPGYMSITSDDPTEIEEERRLCYVGITRAKERLTLTASRLRMNRGELQYNKVSRFIREIPSELLSGNLAKERQQPVWQTANAGMATARKAFHAPDSHKSSQTAGKRPVTGQKPDYDVGDRVRHAKFGEGRVVALEQGKKDYEVTVEFDTAGRKKMFAGFAKMQKV